MKKENVKYMCRVCEATYDTLEEANACENKCLEAAAIKLAEKEKAEKVEALEKELEALYAEEEKIEQAIEAYDEEIKKIEVKIREEEDKLTEIGKKIFEKEMELRKEDAESAKPKIKEEKYILNGEDVNRDEFFNGLEKMFQSFFPFS